MNWIMAKKRNIKGVFYTSRKDRFNVGVSCICKHNYMFSIDFCVYLFLTKQKKKHYVVSSVTRKYDNEEYYILLYKHQNLTCVCWNWFCSMKVDRFLGLYNYSYVGDS